MATRDTKPANEDGTEHPKPIRLGRFLPWAAAVGLTAGLGINALREKSPEPAEKKEDGRALVVPNTTTAEPIVDPVTKAEREEVVVEKPKQPEENAVPPSPKRGYVLRVPIDLLNDVKIFGGAGTLLQFQYTTIDENDKKTTHTITSVKGKLEPDAIDMVITDKNGTELESPFMVLENGAIAKYNDGNFKASIYTDVQKNYNAWAYYNTLADEYKAAAQELKDFGPFAPAQLAEFQKKFVDLLVKRRAMKLHDQEVTLYVRRINAQGIDPVIKELKATAETLTSEISSLENGTDAEAQQLLLEKKSRQSLQSYLADQKLDSYAQLLTDGASVDSMLEKLRQDGLEKYEAANSKSGNQQQVDSAINMLYVADVIERDWFALRAQELQNTGKVDAAIELFKNGRADYIKTLRAQLEEIESRAKSFAGRDPVALTQALSHEVNSGQNAYFYLDIGIEVAKSYLENPEDANFFADEEKKYRGYADNALGNAHKAAANGRPARVNTNYGQRVEEKEPAPSGNTSGVTIETYAKFPEKAASPERFINPEKGEGRGVGGEGKK